MHLVGPVGLAPVDFDVAGDFPLDDPGEGLLLLLDVGVEDFDTDLQVAYLGCPLPQLLVPVLEPGLQIRYLLVQCQAVPL